MRFFLGGMKAAYQAYDKLLHKNGEEKLLVGINLNQRQMFWVSGKNFDGILKR
jgi:hypothetical protein